MSTSKTVTQTAEGATTADATISDIFTTVFSTEKAVTGVYGVLQKVLLVGTGMVVESKMRAKTFKPSLFGG